MYTKQFSSRYVRSAIFLAAVSCSNPAPASTIVVSYDFEDPAGVFENAPATAVPGIDALPWFDQRDSLSDFSGNPGRAIAARSFLAGNTLTLILNLSPGFRASLDGFSFDHLASSSGPATWDLKINAVPIASGDTSSAFTSVAGALSLDNITETIMVELSGFDASSNAGTYRVDNFVLTGTVVPVPIGPGILLLGSALAFMAPRRKR